MRRLLSLTFAVLALTALPARAAAPIRLVEAFTTPDFNAHQVLQVTAASSQQRSDVNFNVMASLLGDALEKAGLNIHQDATKPDVYVLLDYKAWAVPFFRRFESSVSDPSYRALVVTAIDARAWENGRTLKIVWQVVVDQTGISNDADATVPPLVEAAARFYGRNLTPVGLNGAASCDPQNGSQVGSHIAGNCISALTPLAAGAGFASIGGSAGAGSAR